MKPKFFLLVLLFSVALFLRLYRIDAHTEFLGDQGRTGLEIYEYWKNKELPQVGPTVLTGEHLGPAFYYIVAPAFILSGFNPLAPALMTVFFGIGAIFLLFVITSRMFGFAAGFEIASIYAVLPSFVRQDRTLWEPNLIPFFVFCYLFSLLNILGDGKARHFVYLGISIGVLVQLHYPNVFFIPFTFLFFLFFLIKRLSKPKRKINYRQAILRMGIAVFSFVLCLLPFVIHEMRTEFTNSKGIVLTVLQSGEYGTSGLRFKERLVDISQKVFGRVVPFLGGYKLLLVASIVLLTVIISFRKATFILFLVLGLLIALFAMSLFKGYVFDHYLFFMLPFGFIIFAGFLAVLSQRISQLGVMFITSIIVILSIQKTDIFTSGRYDIEQTRSIVENVSKYVGNNSFSFTIISSHSYSDLHHRYFYKIQDILPESITSKNYSYLVLVCEKTPCLSIKDIEAKRLIEAMCYEKHCGGNYPIIDISAFQFVSIKQIDQALIYFFHRKST